MYRIKLDYRPRESSHKITIVPSQKRRYPTQSCELLQGPLLAAACLRGDYSLQQASLGCAIRQHDCGLECLLDGFRSFSSQQTPREREWREVRLIDKPLERLSGQCLRLLAYSNDVTQSLLQERPSEKPWGFRATIYYMRHKASYFTRFLAVYLIFASTRTSGIREA